MILLDTNIIIDFWKNPKSKFEKIILENDVFICGVVKSELLHGARNTSSIGKILDAVSVFPELPLYKEFWIDLGFNLNILKTNGITVPFQDVMIATLAIKFQLKLWTLDKHFKKISEIIPDLQIFDF